MHSQQQRPPTATAANVNHLTLKPIGIPMNGLTKWKRAMFSWDERIVLG
jgi:hypothetical protein